MKKLLSLALTITMSISLAYSEIHSGTCGDNLSWSLDTQTGSLVIEGSGTMNDGYYANWYSYRNSVKSVSLPEGLENISDFAFYGCNMSSIELPNSVKAIGSCAFEGCSLLKTAILNEGLVTIGNNVFKDCHNITSITIPNSVTSIGWYAFHQCSNLQTVSIGSGVKSIGTYAFYGCTYLESITIPDNVEHIGDWTFTGCMNLSSVTLGTGINAIGNFAFEGCQNLTSITIPDNITKIGSNAFYGSGLTFVTIPNGVDSLGMYSFYSCKNLASVDLGNRMKYIGDGAFSECTKLQSIIVPATVTGFGSDVFLNCSKLATVSFQSQNPPEFTNNCFANTNCNFNVPCGTKDIYWNTLNYYADYTISKSRINESLSYTYSLAPFDETKGDVRILHAPSSCEDPTLSFRADAKSGYRFKQWSDGNTDNSRSLTLTQDTVIFASFEDNCIFASGTCGANGDNLTWKLSCEGVLTISGNGAMKDYQLYESENPWFNYSGEINSVIIEEGVTYIGISAFEHDSYVETIQLPNSLLSIGSRAFVWCERLKELEMPNSVVSIQDNLFGACMALKKVTLSTELTEIPEYTFNGCPIKSIVVPNKVRKIGQFAFAWCDSLESITMPNEIYEIGGNNFVDCRSLTEFIFPDSLTEIGDGMFIGCTNLTHIDIHERITAIGIRAFERAGLQSIICRVVNPPALAREPFLGNGVFQDVDKTIPLYVPSESIEAYKAADQWNEFFNILPLEAIPTSLEYNKDDIVLRKTYHNGQIFILRGDKTYSVQGQEVR